MLEEIMSVKSTDTNTEYSVSREEIHKAYYILYKSKRIRVMNPSLSKFLKTVLKCVGMAVVSTILSIAVYLIFKDWTLVKSTFISVFSVYVTLIIYQNYIQK